jgi:DNA-binding winged helix-turn-helix (wHTH) protein
MSAPRHAVPLLKIDAANGCVWRRGKRISLSPTDFAVLQYLAAHAGRLVTHAELLKAVWPTTTVDKGVLKVRLRRIRQALGDRAHKPRFIETAQRRGYRFIAPVSTGAPTARHGRVPRAPRTMAVPPGGPTAVSATFVGREREMASLQGALDDAVAGRGRLVLLVGDPGIGKTRTAEELATAAQRGGARVLVGRCHDGHGTPPFWPWVQIVRSYLGDRDPIATARALGRDAAEIAHLLPTVRAALPRQPVVTALEPEHERFRLFDAFVSFLKRIARRKALVIVIDDLHWADAPSLLLLQFVARELAGARVLIIATYREIDLKRTHPLAAALGELARIQGSQRLPLQGLTQPEVARFVEVVTQRTPGPSLVAALYKTTEGNPFFVTEVMQALVSEGRLAQVGETAAAQAIGLPQRVREAITQRLSTLSATGRRVLTVAAVIGREFDLMLLGRALAESKAGPSGDSLQRVLDDAAAAHFIAADGAAVGRYRFSHALVRQTLYESLSPTRRMALHSRIGTLLEEQRDGDRDATVAALASHFCLAAPRGAPDKAIAYATRAGEQAMAVLGYEEAASYYQRALQVLELKPDNGRRCELLLALGDAQRQAGQTGAAKETFATAASLVRARAAQVGRRKTGQLLARAALGLATGFAGVTATGGVADTFVLDLLEEALHALGDVDSPLRARVLGRLAVELYWSAAPERRAALSEQAVDMARRTGDRAALAYTLNARCIAVWAPETLGERLAAADEIMRLADEVGDRDLALLGHMRRLAALLELGDVRTADREIAIYAQRARALRQPSHLWFLATWRAMRTWLGGDFEHAERLAREAFEIGERAQDPDAAQCFTVQIFGIRSGGKGLKDVELPAKGFAAEYAAVPAWRAGTALLYADLGHEAAARQEFEQLAAKDFGDLPRNADWMITMASLAQLCAFLRDARRARLLYDLLLPYAARCVVVGHGLVCLGSVERFLALLATAQQRWQEAEAHFDAALQRNRQLGAKPLVALTEREYAMMLLARNAAGDRERALRALDETLDLAQQLGMQDLIRRVQALQERCRTTPTARSGLKAVPARITPRLVRSQRSRSTRG